MGSELRYVDHTYRDFSRYAEEGGEFVKHKKWRNNFPARLHRMLSDWRNSGAVAWMPHGRAWRIIDKERLVSEVLPGYYVCKKYESFSRQLNGWGFKRLHQHGRDHGCYYHECFLRDLPKLTRLIRRLPANLGKSVPFPEGEPDFYRISEACPLPPPRGGRPSTAPARSSPTVARVSPREPPRARAGGSDSLSALVLPPASVTPNGVSRSAGAGDPRAPPTPAAARLMPEVSAEASREPAPWAFPRLPPPVGVPDMRRWSAQDVAVSQASPSPFAPRPPSDGERWPARGVDAERFHLARGRGASASPPSAEFIFATEGNRIDARGPRLDRDGGTSPSVGRISHPGGNYSHAEESHGQGSGDDRFEPIPILRYGWESP